MKVQVDARLANQRTSQASQIDNAIKQGTSLKSELEQARLRFKRVQQQSIDQTDAIQRSTRQAQQEQSTQAANAIAAMRGAYPAVRELLTPFTTSGYRQPGPSGRLKTTANSQPLSYSGLLRMRALEDSKKGREILFYAVQPSNAFGKLNDRPLGNFPRYGNFNDIDKAEVQQKLKRAQTFLRNHGEAMTETGMLSP